MYDRLFTSAEWIIRSFQIISQLLPYNIFTFWQDIFTVYNNKHYWAVSWINKLRNLKFYELFKGYLILLGHFTLFT